MIWLGRKRGYLTDWLTQQWVKATGRRVDLDRDDWLAGPVAPTTGIGAGYFAGLADEQGLRVEKSPGTAGILPAFAALQGPGFTPSKVKPACLALFDRGGLPAQLTETCLGRLSHYGPALKWLAQHKVAPV